MVVAVRDIIVSAAVDVAASRINAPDDDRKRDRLATKLIRAREGLVAFVEDQGRVPLASDFGKRLQATISCHLTQTSKESA